MVGLCLPPPPSPRHLSHVLLLALQDALVLLLTLLQQLQLQPVLQLARTRVRALGALAALARRGPGGLLAGQGPAEATWGQALSPRPPPPASATGGRARRRRPYLFLREPFPGPSLRPPQPPAPGGPSSASCAAPLCSSSSQRRAPRRSRSRSSFSCRRCSFTTPFSSRSSSGLAVRGSAGAGVRCAAAREPLPTPLQESRTLPRLVPEITRTQQALPAAFFAVSSLALYPAAARATGWADRCPGGWAPWFWPAPPCPLGVAVWAPCSALSQR